MGMEFLLLGIIQDAIQWMQVLWWLWLFIIAYFYYAWARDHLAFSPLLTLAVSAILIYYLVIEYPLFGSLGLLGYTLIFSGVLYLLPMMLPFLRRKQ